MSLQVGYLISNAINVLPFYGLSVGSVSLSFTRNIDSNSPGATLQSCCGRALQIDGNVQALFTKLLGAKIQGLEFKYRYGNIDRRPLFSSVPSTIMKPKAKGYCLVMAQGTSYLLNNCISQPFTIRIALFGDLYLVDRYSY